MADDKSLVGVTEVAKHLLISNLQFIHSFTSSKDIGSGPSVPCAYLVLGLQRGVRLSPFLRVGWIKQMFGCKRLMTMTSTRKERHRALC